MNKIVGINIAKTIEQICDKNGINYQSRFLEQHESQIEKDKDTIVEIYFQLIDAMAKLKEIQERYLKIPDLYAEVEKTLSHFEDAKHELMVEVNKIIRKNKNKGMNI